MELFAGPASLGGLIMGVAVCAWGLGRWQALGRQEPVCGGGASGPQTAGDQTSLIVQQASPAPHQVRGEQPEADGAAGSLAELHEEIIAFRQREQVLARYAPDTLRIERPAQPSPDAPPLTRV